MCRDVSNLHQNFADLTARYPDYFFGFFVKVRILEFVRKGMMKSLQLLVVLIGTVVGQEAGCAEQTTCEECAAYNRGSVSTALFISMVYCIEYFSYIFPV